MQQNSWIYSVFNRTLLKLYETGKLEGEEDFQEWTALYETKQHRENLFEKHISEH